MDTSGGSGGTPTRTVPGNPDRGSSTGLVIGIVLVLVLLLGGGGTVLAAKAGVFGYQFAAGDLATTTSMSRVADDTCGASNTGPLGGTTTTRAQPTATATPQPTATTARPTATAKPKPTVIVIPVPTVSITQPANNSTYAVSGTTFPNSGPIPFHASASPGTGANSVTITWVDNLDGTLGTGTTLSKGPRSNCNGGSNPTTTTHHVTARAQNNLRGKASATITITVTSGCHF